MQNTILYFIILTTFYSCLTDTPALDNQPTVRIISPNSTSIPSATPSPGAADASGFTRPNEQIFVASDNRCGCQQNKAITLNNCDFFCSSKGDQVPTLYATVTLGEAISLDPRFGTLWGWCNNDLRNGQKPGCTLEIRDGASVVRNLAINLPQNSNGFSADISSLDANVPYTAFVLESSSGARSKGFNLMKINPDEFFDHTQGVLQLMPVHQYVCVNFSASVDKSVPPNVYALNAIIRHFYFPEYQFPPAISASQQNIYCHNAFNSVTDSSSLPRLGLRQNMLMFWSPRDVRFADLTGSATNTPNNIPDINDFIAKELSVKYGRKNASINIFFRFPWYTSPASTTSSSSSSSTSGGSSSASSNETVVLGYVMQPFINAGVVSCPSRKDLQNSSNPLYQILNQYIGTDTEGIYLAVSDPETVTDNNGVKTDVPPDYLLIREGLASKIWFYLDKNLEIPPNPTTIRNKTIKFYWPAAVNYPRDKKSWQKVYTIYHPSNLGSAQKPAGINFDNAATLPADNRFGCIPKINPSSENQGELFQ